MRGVFFYKSRSSFLIKVQLGIRLILLVCMVCGMSYIAVYAGPSNQGLSKAEATDVSTLTDLSGRPVLLSDYLGQNVLLVFTTTWCPHCVTVIPDLKRIDNDSRDKGLKVVAVYVNESSGKVTKFKARHGMPYEVLLDLKGDMAYIYGIHGVPTFIVLDTRGKVVYNGYDIPSDIISRITGNRI